MPPAIEYGLVGLSVACAAAYFARRLWLFARRFRATAGPDRTDGRVANTGGVRVERPRVLHSKPPVEKP